MTSARRERRETQRHTAQQRNTHHPIAELIESRTRLVDASDAERRRLERDLHDGLQQDLIAILVSLDDALAAIKADPVRAEQLLMSIGVRLDDALGSLRSLARGIYPALLHDRGVGEALRSAALRSPVAVSVSDRGVGRSGARVEVAVYFCCLEALQNVTKHAGAGVSATIRLWRENGSLHFQVQDDGSGFEVSATPSGSGLTNMRDRIAAVGGTLEITSRPGEGTTVLGRVPVTSAVAAREQELSCRRLHDASQT